MSAGCKDMPLDKALNIVDPDSHTRANPDIPIQKQKETFLKACSTEDALKWVEKEIREYCDDGMLVGPEIDAVESLLCIRNELNRCAKANADYIDRKMILTELRKYDKQCKDHLQGPRMDEIIDIIKAMPCKPEGSESNE